MTIYCTEPKNAAKVAKMRELMGAKNDRALAMALDVMPPVISKIKSGKLPIGDLILVRLHEMTGLGTIQIKEMLWLPFKRREIVA